MPLFSSGKIPKDSTGIATASFSLNPHGIRKVTHLTIISSFGPSVPSSSNTCSATCKKFLAERSLNIGKHSDRAFLLYGNGNFRTYATTEVKEGSTTIMAVKNSIQKRPLWRKLIRSKKVRSIILLNIVSVVYASNILVVKETEAFMDPAAFSAVRFAVCAIPFVPFVFQARNDVQTRKAGLELGLWMSLGYLMEALGLITAEAGRASFLSLFTVIAVPLLQSMLGTIVPTRTWFGILMSVLGIGMLECGGSPPNVGDMLNFLSAIFFGIHTLRTEHVSKSTNKDQHLPLLGYEVCVVAFLSSIWCILGGSFDGLQDNDCVTWTLVWDWMVAFPWIPALYTGLFSTVLCLWAEIAALRDVSAAETVVIYGTEPLWGAGFAWFLLGERWGAAGWIGAALILGGSLLVQMYEWFPSESKDVRKNDQKHEFLMVTDNRKQNNNLSATPIVVRSKDVMNVRKK